MPIPTDHRLMRVLARCTGRLALPLLLLGSAAPSAAGDRERCDDPARVVDREACLREAAAVRAERSRGAEIDIPAQDDLLRNARARCEPLPDDQRADCLGRVAGHGATRGSVEGGAILRETVTREIGGPPPVVPVEVQ